MRFKHASEIIFTPHTAYLIGVIQGDGHAGKVVNKKGHVTSLSIVIAVGHNDEDYTEVLKKIIKKQLNYDAKIYNDPTCFRVGIYDRGLVRSLEEFKHRMTIPSLFLNKKELLSAYLQGLFDTDGCCTIDKKSISGTVDFSTNREEFAKEIKDVLEKFFEIYSSIQVSRKGMYKPVYRVVITNKSNIVKFVSLIGFRHPRKIKVSHSLVKEYNKIKERAIRNRGHEKILDQLKINKELSINEIANKLNLHRETIKEHLQKLEKKELVEKRVVYFNRWGIIEKPACKRYYWRLSSGT